MGKEKIETPDLRKVISQFRQETYNQIMGSYQVQHLPLTPRERISRYLNTGEGVSNTSLREFGTNSPDQVGFVFTVPEHMRFAEVGTVGGLRGSEVQRGRKYKPERRYVRSWNPIVGETHRPVFSPQLRNLQRRLGNFLRDYYGQQYMAKMFDALGGEITEDIDLGF